MSSVAKWAGLSLARATCTWLVLPSMGHCSWILRRFGLHNFHKAFEELRKWCFAFWRLFADVDAAHTEPNCFDKCPTFYGFCVARRCLFCVGSSSWRITFIPLKWSQVVNVWRTAGARQKFCRKVCVRTDHNNSH